MTAPTPARIVFDLGAVVLHWQPAQLLMRELPHVATDEAVAAHWVREIFQSYGGDWGNYDRGTVTVPDLVDRIARRTGLSHTDVQAVVDAVPRELQPLPDTVALIELLQDAGHALYYLSNMPAPVADHLMATHAVMRCFRDGVFSGHAHLCKPEPAIYELAARRFDASPGTLHFLDDHAPNVAAAQACGWQALQFVDAAQAQAEMRQRGWIA